jgi:glycosyltransferase involved in cell wall biosynthesis
VHSPHRCQVSVVIPVFNSARLVGTALRSVFSQTFPDFEVIVVDDGSEDQQELEAALAPWLPRIQYVRQSNGGAASARNTAIARASGGLVAFLDADDEWLPEKLARQVAYFLQYPEAGLLHTAMLSDVRQSVAMPGPPRNMFCELFHSSFFINTLTVMVPRVVLTEVGGFDERREIHIEDYDLWLRIAARYPVGYIPEPLAYHRPGGLMSRQMERTYAGQALVMEKNRTLCATACAAHREKPRRCDRARRHVLYRDWGYDRLESGNTKGAREQLGRAVAYSPGDVYTIGLYFSTFLSHRWRARLRGLIGRLRRPERAEVLSTRDRNIGPCDTDRAARHY